MTKLTTHCLDTFSGKPAKGVKVDVYSVSGKREKLNSVILNSVGRSDKPLIEGTNFIEGKYELVFFVGDYFKKITDLPSTPFLNEIVIKFGVFDPKEHYHVPLLVTPWSYSTYRGS
jgi:5-hydroxyisourate hydrolase